MSNDLKGNFYEQLVNIHDHQHKHEHYEFSLCCWFIWAFMNNLNFMNKARELQELEFMAIHEQSKIMN